MCVYVGGGHTVDEMLNKSYQSPSFIFFAKMRKELPFRRKEFSFTAQKRRENIIRKEEQKNATYISKNRQPNFR